MSPFILVILMLVLSAFFSGLEIAFVSVNKLRVELKSNQGKHWAKMLSNYIKSPSKFISTILVGNNVTLVIYGITMEEIIRPQFEYMGSSLALIIATLISTGIVLITAEFLPKALFRLNPSGILSLLIYPFQLFYFFLWPLVQLVIWLSSSILSRVLKTDFTEKTPAFSKIDLDHFISQSSQHTSDEEDPDVDTEILKNALDFGNVKVRDCLVPRTEITAIDISTSIKELEQTFVDSQHSKILVYKENLDHIIGYVHHLDLHKKPKSVKSILIPILITNESKSANDMLNEFSKTQKSIALVVDEYGGTAGVITLEDIMEEIFGEIEDEHDEIDLGDEEALDETKYSFSAKLEVDYLNEKYDLNIPDGDYETLGGFVVANLEEIPSEGEVFIIDNFEIKVTEASDKKIEMLELTVLE
ncbi:MAG: hemolysin family protein [Bacteroidia bacterium]|nr:hemolysin family protein [Bacteroidia bacterium]NNJ54615.1 HlyC/CorC family transporter [Bacteroidia bacterium]